MDQSNWQEVLFEVTENALSYTSDPVLVNEGAVFVATQSYEYDGHDFIAEVARRNPVAIVVQKGRVNFHSPLMIEVPDPREAHQTLARWFRRRFKGKVIGVGGSNGKTTTKDFIHSLLSLKYRVIKTEGSRNGHRGIPITLEKLSQKADFAVIEIGIDGPGEMARHLETVAPDLAVLTSIGEEHLRQLTSLEMIFAEERILCDWTVRRGGKCFIPSGDPYLGQLLGTPGVEGISDSLETAIEARIRDLFPFEHHRQCVRLAVAVAKSCGVEADLIEKGLSGLRVPPGRGSITEMPSGWTLIEDHFNANPASMQASLRNASHWARERGLPLTLILGDMLDLGEKSRDAHLELVDAIHSTSPAAVFLVGGEMSRLASNLEVSARRTFSDASAAAAALMTDLPPRGAVLVKGSRGSGLDECVQVLKKALSGRE